MSGFSFTLGSLTTGVRSLHDTLPERVAAQIAPLLPEIETWLKDNHPWENRTGRAEAGLTATIAEQTADFVTVALAHDPSLDYPWWLETRYGGRWGVIRPALDLWGPRLLQACEGLL